MTTHPSFLTTIPPSDRAGLGHGASRRKRWHLASAARVAAGLCLLVAPVCWAQERGGAGGTGRTGGGASVLVSAPATSAKSSSPAATSAVSVASPKTAAAADVLSLLAPEAAGKLAFAKQLEGGASGCSLAWLNGTFYQKVYALSDAAMKANAKKQALSAEFLYAVAGREFFARISAADFKRLQGAKRREATEFFKWLFKNPDMLFQFCELGPATASQTPWFSDWFELYSQRPNSRSGLGQKAAFVLAHANAAGKISHDPKNAPATELLARYDWFMDSAAKKNFLRDMNAMPPRDLRFVLAQHFPNEDLQWCQKQIAQPGFRYRGPDKIADSFHLVRYRTRNDKGIHIGDTTGFYEGNPLNIETYVRYGGQCVAVSRTGAAFTASAGVPAFIVTQPKHLAYFWKDTNNRWRGANDISGWSYSDDQKQLVPWGGPPESVLLYEQFHSASATARASLALTWAARSEHPGTPRRAALYKAAIETAPKNYEALGEYLVCARAMTSNLDSARDFLLGPAFSGLAAHPLLLQTLLSDPETHSFLHKSRQKNAHKRFQEGIYTRYAKAGRAAPANSALTAATRYFLQNTPEIKIQSAVNIHETHGKIKTFLQTNPHPAETRILEELQLALRSTLPDASLSNAFFAHLHTLCARYPAHKKSVQSQLETFAQTPGLADVSRLSAWSKQIAALPDQISTETRKAQKDKRAAEKKDSANTKRAGKR